MAHYSIAEAKDKLPSLVKQAEAGEEVVITRHGRPVAEIRPRKATTPEERAAIDKWLFERAKTRPVNISSVELLDRMYDENPW